MTDVHEIKAASIAAPASIKVAFLGIVGLNTDAGKECFGMRAWAEGLAARMTELLKQFAEPLPAVSVAPTFASYSQINAGNAVSFHSSNTQGADLVVMWGHSFGGGACKFVGDCVDRAALDAVQHVGPDQAWRSPTSVHLQLNSDPCPNVDRFGQLFSWRLGDLGDGFRWHAPACVGRSRTIYQRRQWPVCGVQFSELDGRAENENCRARFGDLDHVDTASSPLVQAAWDLEVFDLVRRHQMRRLAGAALVGGRE